MWGCPVPLGGAGETPGCVAVSLNFSVSLEPAVGIPFYYDLNGLNSGGDADIWYIDFLPAGLSLNASTGIISGTPTTSGSYQSTVNASNECTFTSQTAFIDWTVL